MKRYNAYHTTIKQLARSGKLPQAYADQIDRSTIWRWKHEPENKYLGSELSSIDLLEEFLERKESEIIIRSYLKLATALSLIIKKTSQFQVILHQEKELFIRSIQKFKSNISLKLILRLLNISPSVFYHWKDQVLKKCPASPLRLCRRFYINQLSLNETNRMKQMLTDPEFRHWPVNSIAYFAMRNNIVNASLSTWYNYIQKLGWQRPRPPKKSRYDTGIRANHPNQIWHADITIVKCLNGMKYYVYLLMDNFSRFVLNYQISEKVSAEIRLEGIRKAYDQYISGTHDEVKLIVDGGVENNNQTIDNYTSSEEIKVKKLIAGKDISFSNSMVEAQNKIIKYHYLFKHDCNDINELRKQMEWIIPDYNHKRPHHSLKGLTPHESLIGSDLPKERWKTQIQEAKRIRIQQNLKQHCELCRTKSS